MPFELSVTKQSGKGSASWNGVAILARNHVPVLTCASLPGNPEDHQARYIEAAVQGVLITSISSPMGIRSLD
jgi:exodeoxyribonuclease-3